MEQYPFYLKFIRIIQFQFRLLSRVRSVINAPREEICEKNKLLSIKMMLVGLEEELEEVEATVLQEEFNHTEQEILSCQQKITALSSRFTLFLN